MVASVSCPAKPHLVNVLKCGKLTCDCLNYQSKSLCSHVIATAESIGELRSLISWFKRTNQEPSLWKLSRSSGLPKNPGYKPGQSKRSRKSSVHSTILTRSKLTLPQEIVQHSCSLTSNCTSLSTSVTTSSQSSISITSPITAPSVTITSPINVPSISITSPITAPSVTITSPIYLHFITYQCTVCFHNNTSFI